MRSATLLAVAVLAIVLAVSPPAYAQPPAINLAKVTTNGDTKTHFTFQVSGPNSFSATIFLTGGGTAEFLSPAEGSWTIVETVPSGWVLRDISCGITLEVAIVASFNLAAYAPLTDGSSFTVNLAAHSVTIQYALPDVVACTFTNDPASVGGIVESVNTSALVSPWLAVIGLGGCIGVVAVAVKRRRS